MKTIEDQIVDAMSKLGWHLNTPIVVDIGGTQVSGIDVGEDYNEKWQSPIGTRKYNKDAFIVIKRAEPVVGSEPNPDLIGHHFKESNDANQA